MPLTKFPEDLNLTFPDWREQQLDGIDWIMQDWEDEMDSATEEMYSRSGAWTDVHFDKMDIKVLNAPPGSGKTGIILGAIKSLPKFERVLILCGTKVEQEQYLANLQTLPDTDIMKLSGKNNYHCIDDHPYADTSECTKSGCKITHVDEAPCQDGYKCPVKEMCPYYGRKTKAQNTRIVVTNYAFGLSILNYAKMGWGPFDLIVCDEAHQIEEYIGSFVGITLYRRQYERLTGESLPLMDRRGGYGNTLPAWKTWAVEQDEFLQELIPDLLDNWSGTKDVEYYKSKKEKQKYADLWNKVKRISLLDDNYIPEEDTTQVSFSPVWMDDHSKNVLFRHGRHIVMMSGTMPITELLVKKSGLSEGSLNQKLSNGSSKRMNLPITFPKANRLITVMPKVKLDRKHIDQNLGRLAFEVDELLDSYQDSNVLIHTVSYKVANAIFNGSSFRDRMLTHTTTDRMQVLEEFKQSTKPAILLSPSMEQAIDLSGDQCRAIIIPKIPYPFLGSKIIQRRMKGGSIGRRYYNGEAVLALIQMAFRGVRSMDDWCYTYILDASAVKFFRQTKNMIPKEVRDAMLLDEDSSGSPVPFFSVQ